MNLVAAQVTVTLVTVERHVSFHPIPARGISVSVRVAMPEMPMAPRKGGHQHGEKDCDHFS